MPCDRRVRRPHRRFGERSAFSLIELLVVIAVIGLLIAVALTIGGAARNGARATATTQTIGVLDSMIEAYSLERGGVPPPYWSDPAATVPTGSLNNTPPRLPIADARGFGSGSGDDAIINSVGLLLAQMAANPSTSSLVDNLNPEVVQSFDPDGGDPEDSQPELATVYDAWGRPLRYVHPIFDGNQFDIENAQPAQTFELPRRTTQVTGVGPGGPVTSEVLTGFRRFAELLPPSDWVIPTIRRNAETESGDSAVWAAELDADGGRTRGGRPYFYSVGADGFAGYRMDGSAIQRNFNDDNVYSEAPEFLAP